MHSAPSLWAIRILTSMTAIALFVIIVIIVRIIAVGMSGESSIALVFSGPTVTVRATGGVILFVVSARVASPAASWVS